LETSSGVTVQVAEASWLGFVSVACLRAVGLVEKYTLWGGYLDQGGAK
jgi:hypothetical protein